MKLRNIISTFILSATIIGARTMEASPYGLVPKIETPEELAQFFRITTPAELEQRTNTLLAAAGEKIKNIKELLADQRTCRNTTREIDGTGAAIGTHFLLIYLVSAVYDSSLQSSAEQCIAKLSDFNTRALGRNRDLYQALKEYAEKKLPQENVIREEEFFVREALHGYEQSGLNLPDDKLEELKKLDNDIMLLRLKFEANIASKNAPIACTKDELTGLDQSLIESLERDAQGRYLLPINEPTYFAVLRNCSAAHTREQIWVALNARAYPENEEVLRALMKKQLERAQLLGYQSFAHQSIDGLLAESPEKVEQFLNDLDNRSRKKYVAEAALLKGHLPADVKLTPDGQMYPWDVAYAFNYYKKNFLQIDSEKITEYFSVEHTINELLSIFAEFLDLEFRRIELPWKWHEDVQYIAVYEEGKLVGHLLLDLYPRPGKHDLCCSAPIVDALAAHSGEQRYPVNVILANFPKATATKPALLKLFDVESLFHEFGHAMHSMLSKTSIASLAGTNVKLDFVEVPSQLFEQWPSDKHILKRLSHHYQTGEQLDDATIEKIDALDKLGKGQFVQFHTALSRCALTCFGRDADCSFDTLDELAHSPFKDEVATDPRSKLHCNFHHLSNYGACYYTYLFSMVYSLDFFDKIKKEGLLNKETGKRLKETVLSRGGSIDPRDMVQEFLGRPVSADAFAANYSLTN